VIKVGARSTGGGDLAAGGGATLWPGAGPRGGAGGRTQSASKKAADQARPSPEQTASALRQATLPSLTNWTHTLASSVSRVPATAGDLRGGFRSAAIAALTLCPFAVAVSGCGRNETGVAAARQPAATRFVDVAQPLGVRFRHTSGKSGRLYLPETLGSGCGFLDYDSDGRLDLFFVNSSRLPGFTGKGAFYPALYHQRSDGIFEDVTQKAGLAVDCYGMGVAVGDYDNDGRPDLYLTAMGPNHLFHNNGNGTFTDVTRAAGVGDPRFSTSAAFFDYDRDGKLDLFVCNYCRWSPALNVVCQAAAGRQICPPDHYQGATSTLYHNNGDGTFSDVTRKAGITSEVGKALGVVVCDYDDDGWPDLIVANDIEPNLLYRNNRDGTFREVGVEAGVAYSMAGKARAGMGIDSGDDRNDGREAILIGNNSSEGLALFRPDSSPPPAPSASGTAGTPLWGSSSGGGASVRYSDEADRAGLFQPSLHNLTFGAMFCDLDLDGWKDVVVVNGHINYIIAKLGNGVTYAEPMQLFHNQEGRGYLEVNRSVSPALQQKMVARGLAVGDFDGDGDPDLLVSENNGPAHLLRNDLPGGKHWLQVRLAGTASNREGIGSRVRIEAGGVRQTSWVRSGSSYGSANDLKAYFGLGRTSRIDRLEVRWPTGETETVRSVPVDQVVTLREGQGRVDNVRTQGSLPERRLSEQTR
jgi:hypothetical protein